MVAIAVFLAAVVVGIGGGDSAAREGSTLVRGVVMRGPVTPVCIEGRPCDAPYPGATLTFSRDGRERARVTTNARGRFLLRLAPGTYGIRLLRAGPIMQLSPRAVRVPSVGPLWLRLDVDTGIRAPGRETVD